MRTEASEVLSIPDFTRLDAIFGNISHMPKWDDVPETFHDWHHEPHCKAVSHWFYKGPDAVVDNAIVIDGVRFTPRAGVDMGKALVALQAALTSWEPKHEHKIAGCGFMLSQWFHAAPRAA